MSRWCPFYLSSGQTSMQLTLRYGMVWYGMVWYGMVYGMLFYGIVKYYKCQYKIVCYVMVRYGITWHLKILGMFIVWRHCIVNYDVIVWYTVYWTGISISLGLILLNLILNDIVLYVMVCYGTPLCVVDWSEWYALLWYGMVSQSVHLITVVRRVIFAGRI